MKVSWKDFKRVETVDENPDLSYLGQYTKKPKDNYVIDRKTGQLLGPKVTEERHFEIVHDHRLSGCGLGGYMLSVPEPSIAWLEAARLDGDLDYFEEDDTGRLTVVWTHPEVLADGLPINHNGLDYFESCNHRHPGSPVNWFPHVTKPKLNADFKKANFGKHGIRPVDKHPKEFWLDVFYFCEDYERMEDYNRNGWCCIGISAKVEIKIPNGNGHIIHKVESPGVWGIESDSDEKHKDTVFVDECNVLADMLRKMGMKVVK